MGGFRHGQIRRTSSWHRSSDQRTGGAQATILFSPTPSGTGNNVVFNQQPPDQMGNTIFGNINDPNNTLVQFDSTQILVTPAVGQAGLRQYPTIP